jgi:hypothetical protein
MLDYSLLSHANNMSQRRMKNEGNPMKGKMLLAVLWLVGCLGTAVAAVYTPRIVSSLVAGSEDVASGHSRAEIYPSGETSQENNALCSLALALSSGKDAMRPLRGSQSDNLPEKDRLNLSIAGMDCYLDRITIHVCCHSSLVETEQEAATMLSRLVDEVQAVLPSNTWRGMRKEPGAASIRSHTDEDQRSNAHIDIDLTARVMPGGQNFYMVSLFAWPH